jgi:hypothetical protein
VDDVLDRGDHGVGGLAEDLRVLVGHRCESGHALVALLGVGDSSAHRAHLLLGQPATSPEGAASGAYSSAVADFDADTDFDLAITNYGAGNVTILKNR